MSDNQADFLMILAVTIVLIVIYIVGNISGKFIIRKEAIKNNVAEYRCNSQTGNVEFIWLNPGKKKK